MSKIIRIGMDTSKNVFQLHGVDAEEQVVVRKKLGRKAMIRFFKDLSPCEVGMEACGGSHHWARLLESFDHTVKLMPAQYVKAYVKRGKNDAADAEAACEAMSRPTMRFVPVKTAENQAALMLVGVRDRLVRTQTQVANAMRGHAAEFGLVVPTGHYHIKRLLAQIAGDETIPELARDLFRRQGEEFALLQMEIAELSAQLATWQRQDECARRLTEIPGVGPIGSALLSMKTPDPHSFRSGRQFAAWIGLTPRDHSTAGKVRHGVITRAGDKALRATLVAGATSVIQHMLRGRSKPWPWLLDLLERKEPKLAAIALANKMARIAWKIMVSGERFERRHLTTSSAPQSAN